MSKKSPSPKITLDPIFPITAGTGYPEVKQGDGAKLLKNEKPVDCGMTYRAFMLTWEQVERRAAENYPKYIGHPQLAKVAEAWLEALVWFRQMAHPEVHIERISESQAQEIRAKVPGRKPAGSARAKSPASNTQASKGEKKKPKDEKPKSKKDKKKGKKGKKKDRP